MISAWSYSRLKVFETCPYRAYLAYVEKRPEPAEIDKKAAERGTKIHLELENYIKGDIDTLTKPASNAQDTADTLRSEYTLGTVKIEDDWGYTTDWAPCGWFDDNVWCRMKLDAFHFTSETTADAYDWKSGKKFGNELAHAQQSQFYVTGGFMLYPALTEITTKFVYLDQKDNGPPTTRTYSREKAMLFFKSLDDRARAMTSATEFKAKPNRINCKYCPYGPNNKGDRSCPWGVEA